MSDDDFSGIRADGIFGGLQVGVVHGGANFYLSDDSSKEERFRTGVAYLKSHTVLEAERLISKAIHDGMRSKEALYYWLLSVFATRSIHDISDEDLGRLNRAVELEPECFDSEWETPLRTVIEIVECAQAVGPDSGNRDKILRRIEELPVPRREEVTVHLFNVLRDINDANAVSYENDWIKQTRFANSRDDRVAKFFIRDPVKPVRKVIVPPPLDIARFVKLVLSCVVAVVCAGYAVYEVATVSVFYAALVAMFWTGGVCLGYDPALRWRWFRYQRSAGRASQDSPVTVNDLRKVPHKLRDLGISFDEVFAEDAAKMVVKHFRQPRPYINSRGPNTREYSKQILTELLTLYGNTEVPAGGLEWLVQWHVDEFRRIHDDLNNSADDHFPAIDKVQTVGGVIAILGGVWVTVTIGFNPMSFLLVLALRIGFVNLAPILCQRRDYILRCREEEEAYGSRMEAYREQCEYLKDRPSDSEIATWLYCDQRAFVNDCMSRSELEPRDIAAALVLVEPTLDSFDARVISGPARHSKYRIKLFLMTMNGIRYFDGELRFLKGKWTNPGRETFRYESIVRVKVNPLLGRGDPSIRTNDERDQNAHMFIKLTAGKDITVRVSNREHGEDPHLMEGESMNRVTQIAMDVTGVTTAVRMLEAIASEGRQWLTRAAARRRIIDGQGNASDTAVETAVAVK